MSALKGLVSSSLSVLEVRETTNMLPQSAFEVEIEITGEKELIRKLKANHMECYILQKANEMAVIDSVPTVAHKDYTTFQSVIRTEHYSKFVAMRVEFMEVLRKKNWVLLHRQQGEGFRPQWLTHIWEKRA